MVRDDLSKLSEDVSYLKKDMAVVGNLVDRLDTTIDKLTDISNNISSLLAVHETKLTSQEIITKQTTELVEKRRVEMESKIELLHARISSGERELEEKIDAEYEDIMTQLKEMRQESAAQHDALNQRISTMEKWMWLVIGGSIVVGFILNAIPWDNFF